MAYVIPVTGLTGERGPVVIIIVLTRENLTRMHLGDPFDVQLRNLGPILQGYQLDQADLIIAYEENETALLEFYKTGNLVKLMEWVERGRRHQPGDATPPIRLPRKQESN